MSSIFLSHSSKDNPIAEQVKARLFQMGHRSVFLDFDPADGIPAGRDWEKELYAKLRECRAVIVLCSHASMASRWCFAEITHAKALGKDVFPIKIDDCTVDPILRGRQVIDATAGWDQAYQRLKKGLLAAGLDPNDLFDWDGTRPPDPGLMVFEEKDAAVFFGRDKEIRDGQALLNHLQQFGGPRLTLMLGASGSGKSSLMRAGLLPRLKRDQRWVVVEPFRPLHAPIDELAHVLSERFSQNKQAGMGTPTDVASVRSRIRWDDQDTKQSVDAFLELLKELREKAGAREATVLLMIDQCEELLSLGANKEGDRFLTFLRALLDHEDNHLLVLATLRSDFLGTFQDHQAMWGLRVETFPVPQMRVDDFAAVIEGPAKIAGLDLGPGLVQAMINDTMTSDALPLLAFTLRELYEEFGHDKKLTLEEYRDQLGRLDGCIARAAEAVLIAKPLSEEELLDLRTELLAMVQMNDRDQYAKQPVLWNDLPDSSHEILERFVAARLLISGRAGKGRTLEVAHEALFRAWPRLAGWIKEDRENLFILRRAEIEAGEWERQGYDTKYLWHAERLKQLQGIVAGRGDKSVKDLVRLFMAPYKKYCEPLYDPLLSHQERLRIGQFLVTIGDSRPGVGLNADGLPDIEWIKIPGGQMQLGGNHVFDVKPYHIAKYPVTSIQFETFLNAESGFLNKRWWKDIGHEDAAQSSWREANCPRVHVSWYDAVAFCRWLSAKTGSSIRLPTEWEWQQAVTGGDPTREYPWKGDWDASRCNGQESGLSRTTAVGMYPAGVTQQGVLDMAGNVWEWCLNTYVDAGTTITQRGKRVVRGGSWNSIPEYLRSSSRTRNLAGNRTNFIGFRLAQDLP